MERDFDEKVYLSPTEFSEKGGIPLRVTRRMMDLEILPFIVVSRFSKIHCEELNRLPRRLKALAKKEEE